MSSSEADEKDGKRYSGSTSELEPVADLEKVKMSEVESIHAVSIATSVLLDNMLIFFASRLLKNVYLRSRMKKSLLAVRRVIGRYPYTSLNPTSRPRRRIFRKRYTL
jgi:hypothetical protein